MTHVSARETTDRIEFYTTHRWVVLNCACTNILGFYATEGEAEEAAKEFGSCSFPYHLSQEEVDRMIQNAA